MRKGIAAGLIVIALAISSLWAGTAHALIGVTSTALISATPSGDLGDAYSYTSTMTPDGRYVAFASSSDDLLSSGPITTDGQQIYLYDRQAHTMELVSQAPNGDPGNSTADIRAISLSNDGRYVVFNSTATNLADGQPQSSQSYNNVFLRDRQTGTTTLLSSGTEDFFAGGQAMSGDGNIVTYTNFDPGVSGYAADAISYVYNRTTGVTTQLPVGAVAPRVSNDGNYITYLGPSGTLRHPGVNVALFRYTVATGDSQQFTDVISTATSGAVLHNNDTQAIYSTQNSQTGAADLLDTTIATGQTTTVVANVAASGTYVNAADGISFSTDEHYMSYIGRSNGVHIYVVSRQTGQQLQVDQTGINSRVGTVNLSADGTQLDFEAVTQSGVNQVYVAAIQPLKPAAPTGLAGTTPTNNPHLAWSAVDGADHYVVYRDSASIGTSAAATTFADTNASDSSHNYSVTAVSAEGLAGDASNHATIIVDKTPPTVSSPAMNPTVILLNGSATISANATDSLSGVAGGEYYIDTDPGQGNGTSMAYASGQITATASIASLSVGSHTLYMRARDAAGNWSAPVSVTFIFV